MADNVESNTEQRHQNNDKTWLDEEPSSHSKHRLTRLPWDRPCELLAQSGGRVESTRHTQEDSIQGLELSRRQSWIHGVAWKLLTCAPTSSCSSSIPRPRHRYTPRLSCRRRDEDRDMGAVRDCFDSGQEVTKQVIRTTTHNSSSSKNEHSSRTSSTTQRLHETH